MKQISELDKNQRGVAGEYLVAGELNKRGILASLTIKNTKGIDILASNHDASKSAGIQVKSTVIKRKEYPRWILNEKADNYRSETLFYIFVLLKEGTERPDFYIVPSKNVAEHTKKTHSDYLERGKIRGVKDSSMRIFYDKDSIYLERWDLLEL